MQGLTVGGSESPGSKTSVVRSSREGVEPINEIMESGRILVASTSQTNAPNAHADFLTPSERWHTLP